MTAKFVSRTRLFSFLIVFSVPSLAFTAGCRNSENSAADVTKDELANYEKMVAEMEAKADEDEEEQSNSREKDE